MDLRILWVYDSVFLTDKSSDLAFFWSKEGVGCKRKGGVLDASPVSRNYSLDYCTTILLGWMNIQVGGTSHTAS